MKNTYKAIIIAVLLLSGLNIVPNMYKITIKNQVETANSFNWDTLVDEDSFEEEMKQEIAHHKPPSWWMVKLRQVGCFLLDTQEKVEKLWKQLKAWTALHMPKTQIKISRK